MNAPIANQEPAIPKSSFFSLKSSTLALVAVIAASVFLFVWALPPRPEPLDASAWAELAARTVPGAYHIHTTRSDGLGDRAAVAAAAARAGLKFVILTDHGDGTRPPDPPIYLDGVLVLDGVEISTDEGHYVAFDMPRAPYPLGGAAESVVEDVARLGGFGIAAHADSPKPVLRWTDERAPIDGIEWLNTDSEWRGESRASLARAGLAYFLRPGPALAGLFDRPVTLDRWDRLAADRQVVGLAGADAHGGVGRRAEDPGRTMAGIVGIPSYEASFRAFSNRVVLEGPLLGNPAVDARAILGAIRKGSVFTAIDALAGPAFLDFHVEAALDRVGMGGLAGADSDATIVARASMPRDAQLVLWRRGREVSSTRDTLRRAVTGATGAYRVEVRIPGAPGEPPIPWLVSNPIYFGGEEKGGPRAAPAPAQPGSIQPSPNPAPASIPPFPWRIEKDPASSAVVRTRGGEVSLQYQLGGGERNSQFVALATDLQPQPFTTIDLTLVGDRPLRVSVQLRRADGARWGRSYYVDPAGSSLRIPIADLRSLGGGNATARISAGEAASLLVVVDLANASPGRSGVLRVVRSALVN
jgi:hypothetical protein